MYEMIYKMYKLELYYGTCRSRVYIVLNTCSVVDTGIYIYTSTGTGTS